MAKILKQLVFGQRKNPPEPPRPDYEGDKSSVPPCDTPSLFSEHDYENIPKLKRGAPVRFAEEKQEHSELLVFEEYSEPADLRAEMDADPLYVSPVDADGATAPPLTPERQEEEEEDMYCVPYDEREPLPQQLPRFARGRPPDPTHPREEEEATYDLVPDQQDGESGDEELPPPCEYDEPWEWSVGARLTHSLQVSPTSSSLGEEEDNRHQQSISDLNLEEDTMMARHQQRRLLLYETAFDSHVRRETGEDLDRLIQVQGRGTGEGGPPARAASRSSFGSTSGSSTSSTPTHQPVEMGHHRCSPVTHFTPTERRKVTLVRDRVSAQPQSIPHQTRPLRGGGVINQNFERKISFSSSHPHQPWDSVSRCSSSDRSSSQESMNVELNLCSRNVGRSASRDSLNVLFSDRRNIPSTTSSSSNRKEGAKLLTDPLRNDSIQKSAGSHLGVKVLPTNDSLCLSRTKSSSKSSGDLSITSQQQDPELKENNSDVSAHVPRTMSVRPVASLPPEVRPTLENLPQSPENDDRTSQDYDPPWDLKLSGNGNVLRPSVNGSVSVPERLSSSGSSLLPSHKKPDEGSGSGAANKPNGLPPSRPNLNLNLSSDSPVRKGRQNLSLNFGCTALNAVGEKVDPQLTLEKQGWYHGSISRVDAEGKLRVLKEGSYLVRNSESSKQDYSLSLRSARGFMHMKIVPTSEGRFILGQFSNPFSSIPEMIQHYSVNKLPIKGAEHMSLLYPVIDQLL